MGRLSIVMSIVVALMGCSEQKPSRLPSKIEVVDPAAIEAFNAGVELRETDKDQAIRKFSEAIELEPNLKMAIHNRCLTHAELGHDELALADLAKLKTLEADSVKVLERLLHEVMPSLRCEQGLEALKAENYDKAVASFTAALLYVVDDPTILELRAQAHEKLGHAQQAADDLATAASARKRGLKSILIENETPKDTP